MPTINIYKYRLTGRMEPTDKLLTSLMKRVTEEVERKAADTQRTYFEALTQEVHTTQHRWALRSSTLHRK